MTGFIGRLGLITKHKCGTESGPREAVTRSRAWLPKFRTFSTELSRARRAKLRAAIVASEARFPARAVCSRTRLVGLLVLAGDFRLARFRDATSLLAHRTPSHLEFSARAEWPKRSKDTAAARDRESFSPATAQSQTRLSTRISMRTEKVFAARRLAQNSLPLRGIQAHGDESRPMNANYSRGTSRSNTVWRSARRAFSIASSQIFRMASERTANTPSDVL